MPPRQNQQQPGSDFQPIDLRQNPFNGYLPPALWNAPKDLGYLVFAIEPIPAGGTKSASPQNPAENGFLITAWTRYIVDAATGLVPVTSFPGFVTIKDSANKELANLPMPVEAVLGTAQLPAVVQWPKWVNAASKVTMTVSNPTAAAVNFYAVAWGINVYPNGQS